MWLFFTMLAIISTFVAIALVISAFFMNSVVYFILALACMFFAALFFHVSDEFNL